VSKYSIIGVTCQPSSSPQAEFAPRYVLRVIPPRAFEPGDEEAVTVNDRYGSRAVRAGWLADAFVIRSEDRQRLHLVEQFRRGRDGRLERTVEFSAPQVKTLHVRSVYRLATPAELDAKEADGPPPPAIR